MNIAIIIILLCFRYEAALGTVPGGIDIQDFTSAGLANKTTIKSLSLYPGTRVYASIRATNKANIAVTVVSPATAVSPSASFSAYDGKAGDDLRYQDQLSTMTATLIKADTCPIKTIEWAIYKVDDKIVKEFTSVSTDGFVFETNEIILENRRTYINIFRIQDALNRTSTVRSNGVATYMESPSPGDVRDGPHTDRDMDYQEPVTILTCNWEKFGHHEDNPAQTVSFYEVALGTDRRYEDGRINVHPFLNVGHQLTHTFTNLKLVSKVVQYYCTVKATSLSGSVSEEYSNGIKVGYRDYMIPSPISMSPYIASPDSIAFSWENFDSDFQITNYEWSLLDENVARNGTNNDCDAFDEITFKTVNLNTVVDVSGLDLKHGSTYTVAVRAFDSADHCAISLSEPSLVDVTPPSTPKFYIGHYTNNVIYISDPTAVYIAWSESDDEESDIEGYKISLFQGVDCHQTQQNHEQLSPIISDLLIQNETEVGIYDLALQSGIPYFVYLEVKNKAGLSASIWSYPILVDNTWPIAGDVKDGNNWESDVEYQSSTTDIFGTIALSHRINDNDCVTEEPVKLHTDSHKLNGSFDINKNGEVISFLTDTNDMNDNKVKLNIKHNLRKQEMLASGISLLDLHLYDGNVTVGIQAAEGHEVITSLTFGSIPKISLSLPDYPPMEEIRIEVFDPSVDEDNTSSSEVPIIHGPSTSSMPVEKYEPSKYVTHNEFVGFGIHILGFPAGSKNNSLTVFWAQDKDSYQYRWIENKVDPTHALSQYKLLVKTDEDNSMDITLFVNGEEVSGIYGVNLPRQVSLLVHTWNQNNYVPVFSDPLNPYKSFAIIEQFKLPVAKSRLCHFGKAFLDYESQMVKLHTGLTNYKDTLTTNIDFKPYKTLGIGCYDECHKYDCNNTWTVVNNNNFELLHIHLDNLTLDPGSYKHMGEALNVTGNDTFYEASTYYLVVKAENQLGQSVTAISSGVIIDVTEPVLVSVECVDAMYSMTEHASYQGQNHTLAATWEFTDTESGIEVYEIAAGTSSQATDIVDFSKIGVNSEHKFTDLTLKEDQTYYVTVRATNKAGLSTEATCKGITVDTLSLDVSKVETHEPFVKEEPTFPEDVKATTDASKIGISWGPMPNETETVREYIRSST